MTLMVNGIAVTMLEASVVDSFAGLYPLVLAISVPTQAIVHLSVMRHARGAASGLAMPMPAPAAQPAAETGVPADAADIPVPADAVPAPPVAAAAPRFLARIPARLGRDLVALQMEDHYLRIHTRLGSDLILLRMNDAVAELDGLDGLRVHRSWWVARAALEGVERDGKTMVLRLAGGLAVPVARDRQGEVRAAGWLPGAPRG
jgi:hypothetical protein